MELRSCSHLHFVQALKGDVVTKLLNHNHGRPALKFRKVKGLYENGNTKAFEVNPALRPKFLCVDLPFERDGATTESLSTLTRGAQKVKGEDEASESNTQANAIEEIRLSDVSFANLTLKQIKERCKEKKRKRSKYVNMIKETTETCSSWKPSHCSSQSEDEYDTMEPLICWKSRILKKKKNNIKRECKNNSVSASSENVLSIVKFEEMPNEIFQTEGNDPAPISIKVEFPEPTISDCKDLVVASLESPFVADGCDLETRTFSIEPHIDKHLILVSGMDLLPGDELMADAFGMEIHAPSLCYAPQICVVNEESYEVPDGATNFVSRTSVSAEELATDAFDFETSLPTLFTNKPDDDESFGNEDHDGGNDIQALGGNKMTGGIAEVVFDQFPHLSFLEAKKEDSVTKQHQINNLQVAASPHEDHNPKICNDLQSFPCPYLKSQSTSSNSKVQMPVVITDDMDELNMRQGNGAPLREDGAEVHNHVPGRIIGSPARVCGSLRNSNLSSSLNCGSGSVVHRHDEPVVTKVEESHNSNLQHPPERLLSTRMAISPTSQKKLREAMESNELDPEKYYKYARKLCYGNLIENKTGRLEGRNQITKAEVITSPKKAVRKPKIDSDCDGNVPQASRVVQHNGIGCKSVRSCPESAILFSQQQLWDIESITTKLTKELQFMKEIAEETLKHNLYPDTSLGYSQNEIKIAIQNATRTEESAKRSLSIMARDCSRFCKIMKLAENGSGMPSTLVRKKRKIVFADEAGGMLCDVKTFENDMHCE